MILFSFSLNKSISWFGGRYITPIKTFLAFCWFPFSISIKTVSKSSVELERSGISLKDTWSRIQTATPPPVRLTLWRPITIIVHLLWADDLILVSDSPDGLQRQLNGLFDFCCDIKMVVNEMKTRVMVCGSSTDNVKIKFNNKVLDVVDQYKYLGNIIKRTKRSNEDISDENYQYLCNRAKQAIFVIYKRLKNIGILPVKIMGYGVWTWMP